MKFLHKRYFTR